MLAAKVSSIIKQIPRRIGASWSLHYAHSTVLPAWTTVDVVRVWTVQAVRTTPNHAIRCWAADNLDTGEAGAIAANCEALLNRHCIVRRSLFGVGHRRSKWRPGAEFRSWMI